MSAPEVIIEQRLVQTGIECHTLLQAIHDQLKAGYLREKWNPRRLPGLVKTCAARFLESLAGPETPPRLAVNTGLIMSFGGLHVADGVVTYMGLTFAELAEVNPVLNYFAGLMGLGASITLLKLAILGLIAVIFIDRRAIKSRWGTAALILAVIFYGGVVISNTLLAAGF